MAIQIRRGNDAEWESNKSNIVAGEPAVTLDSERMFVGTGSGTYMELANLDVLADAFDSSASYEVGDFAAYHGKVYKFNTDHSGAWNASDVDEVALADALDSLGDDVYTKAEADALLALKADKSDTYTKEEVEELVQQAEYSNFEMKSVSGDFIHITDGAGLIPVKDLKIGIDAVQDLHGYDHPWVGGAGKNLSPASVSTASDCMYQLSSTWDNGVAGGSFSVNGNEVTITRPSKDYAVYFCVGQCKANEEMTLSFDVTEGQAFDIDVRTLPPTDAPNNDQRIYRYEIPSGTTHVEHTFTSEQDGYVYIEFYSYNNTLLTSKYSNIQLEKGSTATAFAPYANICPISGWTGAKVTRTGKNLLAMPFTYYSNTSTALANYFFVKAGTYKFHFNSINATSWRYIIRMKDENGNDLSASEYNPLSGLSWSSSALGWINGANISYKQMTLTFVTDCFIRILFTLGDTSASTIATEAQLELGSTATAYEPFGTTYSVTWEDEAGTVYGGVLDVTTGELTVTKKGFDMGSLTWTVASGGATPSKKRMFTNSLVGVCVGNPDGAKVSDILCSCYQPMSANNSYSDARDGIALAYGGNLYVNDNAYESATDTTAFVASVTGQTFVATLATPQTYQLSPTEVLTLLGENNIFADTGAVEELIYRISNQ